MGIAMSLALKVGLSY